MKKVKSTLLSLILAFNIGIQAAKADSIMLPDGSILKGKILTVLGGLIQIKTERGTKTVSRELAVGEARDIIEVGFLIKRRFMGEVYYINDNTLEISTPTGNLAINRLKVREVILSQQLPLEAAPHH
ncbi:MAG: hypothetical protein A2104_09265 [Candidatus Melainabacteria bacterium GWF2_32_7]|nr:MAG: hypothetical protein A2104_09265 [Candidatus Melainabacteria bacterium GWF2_32_7]